MARGRLNLDIELDIPPLLPYIQDATPVKTGKMKSEWHEIRPTPTTIIMTNSVPYAGIQVYGGYIKPYRHPTGVMRAEIGGQTVFFKSRKGFYLEGHLKEFTDAINKWFRAIKVKK